jgi:hypothetical protein
MPQLDLDLMNDFIFLAFGGLLLGLGQNRTEEGVVEQTAIANYITVLLETAGILSLVRTTLETSSGLTSTIGKLSTTTYRT